MADFRVMTAADEGFFMQLMDMVGWGMTLGDYDRMLTLSPDGLYIASIDGVDLGMVSTSSYGAIAWIGNLVVLPEARGKGVGAALMEHAMSYLTSKGVKSIRLDGVPLAIPLYHRLGFRDEYKSLRYVGVAASNPVDTTQKMTQDDLNIVSLFDEMVFKASRRDAINHNFDNFPDLAFTAWKGNELLGYIMGKKGKINVKIGPWVCKPGSGVAQDLLYSLMNQVVGDHLWVGLPEGNKDGVSILERNGFTPITSSLRMCYGDCSIVEKVDAVYGLGGPDKG